MNESIWIASFADQCIREKVMMTEPIWTDKKNLEEYQSRLASRRSFPYPVKPEQDGKELREGKDFEFGCDNGEPCLCNSFAECKKPIVIPVEVLNEEKHSPIEPEGLPDQKEGLAGSPSPEAIDFAKRMIALKWTKETNVNIVAGNWQAGYVHGKIDGSKEQEEDAISFASFIHGFYPQADGKWNTGLLGTEYTTEQLYQLFKSQP